MQCGLAGSFNLGPFVVALFTERRKQDDASVPREPVANVSSSRAVEPSVNRPRTPPQTPGERHPTLRTNSGNTVDHHHCSLPFDLAQAVEPLDDSSCASISATSEPSHICDDRTRAMFRSSKHGEITCPQSTIQRAAPTRLSEGLAGPDRLPNNLRDTPPVRCWPVVSQPSGR